MSTPPNLNCAGVLLGQPKSRARRGNIIWVYFSCTEIEKFLPCWIPLPGAGREVNFGPLLWDADTICKKNGIKLSKMGENDPNGQRMGRICPKWAMFICRWTKLAQSRSKWYIKLEPLHTPEKEIKHDANTSPLFSRPTEFWQNDWHQNFQAISTKNKLLGMCRNSEFL